MWRTISSIRQSSFYPEDIKHSLKKALLEETSEVGKTQLKTILKNVEFAEKTNAPICQDTGTPTFFVKAGAHYNHLDQVEAAFANAVHKATKKIPLRPNSINPFTQKNSQDNTGRLIPIVHWEIVEGTALEITYLAKGGGSENVSALGNDFSK